ncbi:MAG: stage II sporulation protein M [Schleiferiaceae bacterium]|jgi:uncharacterized membrane protein SpoIIM required for sporulation|nr:stage II sporulation protein M [Schleiferiaceae bacterium]
MKESDFIAKNKKFWKSSEDTLKQKKSDTGLGDAFTKITDDLSYSQTYYNRRSVRIYLNQLAQNFYNKIHSSGKETKINFLGFWKDELPLIIYQSRRYMWVAALVFTIAVIIGAFSTEMDEDFVRETLGDGYVNMTEENIAEGDPMRVYKSEDFLEMFFRIWVNNLFVSAWIYILGILFCVGTIGILVSNGVMLGTFQYFFYKKGILYESFLTIWQHGTIEILSIIIEGTAGLVLGASLIFPGTLPRDVSLKLGAVRSLKIFLGCVPLITLAAFIESFFTRYDHLPDPVRLLVIIGSFALMFGYYVILPYRKGRKFRAEDYKIDYSEVTRDIKVKWGEIKKNANVFFDMLILLKNKFTTRLGIGALCALIFSIYIVYISPTIYYLDLSMSGNTNILFVFSFGEALEKATEHIYEMGAFFEFYNDAWLWPLVTLTLATLSTLSLNAYMASRFPRKKLNIKHKLTHFFIYTFAYGSACALFFISESWINIGWRFVTLFMLLPLIFWMPILKNLYGIKWINTIFLAIDLYFRHVMRLIGFIGILLLLGYLIQLFFDSPVIYAMLYLSNEFVGISDTTGQEVLTTIVLTFSLTGIGLIFQAYFAGLAVFIDSVYEINTASALKKRIQSITLKRKIYGVETE